MKFLVGTLLCRIQYTVMGVDTVGNPKHALSESITGYGAHLLRVLCIAKIAASSLSRSLEDQCIPQLLNRKHRDIDPPSVTAKQRTSARINTFDITPQIV